MHKDRSAQRYKAFRIEYVQLPGFIPFAEEIHALAVQANGNVLPRRRGRATDKSQLMQRQGEHGGAAILVPD